MPCVPRNLAAKAIDTDCQRYAGEPQFNSSQHFHTSMKWERQGDTLLDYDTSNDAWTSFFGYFNQFKLKTA